MDDIFKKLNYKNQVKILAINAPTSFLPNLQQMALLTLIFNDINSLDKVDFAIVFATKKSEIEHFVHLLVPKLDGDAILWIAYPKGNSKKYKCDFNRDTGWEIMGKFQMEPVRQVAIDEDWSALRFRNVKYIKTITRRETMALTQEARVRTSSNKK
jgi:hypothetical protein